MELCMPLLPYHNYLPAEAPIPTEHLTALRSLQSVEDALRWSLRTQPPAHFHDMIGQDEYCFDLVFALDEGWGQARYLVFDTT